MNSLFMEEAKEAYPSLQAVDLWVSKLLKKIEKIEVTGEILEANNISPSFGNSPNTLVNTYIKFTCSDKRRPFYGYWQPAMSTPAPLLINLPGYGGRISVHPQINDLGYNVLHISPQGYVTPSGINNKLLSSQGQWPVLANTALGISGGYEDWLMDCLLGIKWAQSRPDVLSNRTSLFGTSQGGGTALLLSSILNDKIRCVCADLPFLTNFPLSELNGDAYSLLKKPYSQMLHGDFWNHLGYFDTLSHAHRLTMPVLLTSGGLDTTCPSITIESLFEKLTCTKSYTKINTSPHTHTRESMFLISAWLKMYA